MESGGFAEDYDPNSSLHHQYYESYSDLAVHRLMLEDAQRMSFYRKSIEQSASIEGKVVVDVGSGTGILSMWAARAGAKHVFSIEASSLSEFQIGVVEDNDLSTKITVLGDTVENIIAGGVANFVNRHKAKLGKCGVAVLLSEWMGFYLFHEGMLPSVIRARNFFQDVNAALGVLQPIEMIPERATVFVAPITCKPYYVQRYKNFWRDVDGLDFSRYGRIEYEVYLEQASPLVECLPPLCLLHEGLSLIELNLSTVQEEVLTSLHNTVHFDLKESAEFQQHAREAGSEGRVSVDGFTVWFDVSYGAHTLSTSPRSPSTHWKQTTILLPREARNEELVSFPVEGGELGVEMHISASDKTLRFYTIELELK
ncbi:arginine N-methyltransferase, putative [Trypanosoma brucei brucei TREU927]|uniref:Arginine N-methyltransferase, putative n=1 Tax=Trypanosoma brucei brucei (strain 927/4 GUTat10.1) TaxID=185431 RepID=Q57U70_TRYB2|nr:arginine N-methyltransferase, putative [Trypanosoma brucei brucei TREU927]4LWO_A Chain A, Arginine N-methyltransferase, putative [Trypanosoma brucei brucei TREU927]4LWO_B Chain B, Arginine N-methyltransferase, putative [Trypanosoma brucei brucei TREU927]4LWO_E Chain E, Arginine N-methyltransferase, putative [Trypanosoma brucei brucei TREU927]4LWO_G Chain G, Arginine N-methyltransferase, putative [Trypanosoma brucei brucei TREU927]4LWP_A Chain A, Arginine N-methyltransferase, putative [Trypa